MIASTDTDSIPAAPNARHPFGFSVLVLVLSLLATYICALAFVFVLQRSLPPTDGAYGQSFTTTLGDPFVQTIGGTIATAIGAVMCPIALLCLWHRRLVRCGLFVVAATLFSISIATPFLGHAAVLVAFITALSALVVCRVAPVSYFAHLPSSATQ